MTVQECIEYIDAVEPNACTAAQKAGWLSEVEGKVYTSLFLVQPYEFTPITQSDGRILALPAPYDRMYPRYLQAMIHYANGEYDRYANSMAMFNEVWAEANRWFGGDFDTTDRLRNRSFSAEITPSLGEQVILTLPAGCAVAAGRVLVEQAFSRNRTAYVAPEELPAGTYCGLRDDGSWFHWETTEDLPVKTRLWLGEGMEYTKPGDDTSTMLAISADKDGTELDFTLTAKILGQVVDLTQKGATPLPMITGDRDGTELTITFGPGNWLEAGRIRFTGRMLIPDEQWAYEDRYARRRDLRWQS